MLLLLSPLPSSVRRSFLSPMPAAPPSLLVRLWDRAANSCAGLGLLASVPRSLLTLPAGHFEGVWVTLPGVGGPPPF